jgi:glycosyltransferase involved in cell wall biosynthesis
VSENPKDLIYDIAFIGRLHTERGITELIEIINLIKNRRPSTTIVIVGDGPLKGEIEVELNKWLEDSSISMRGFLPADEILDIYASTKILISTAPHEGYGLTLREAALSNLYVVARESKGALETKLIFPSRIDTFSDSDEAVRLICDGLNNPNFAGSTDAFAAQLASDNQGLQRLAKSWVDL